MMNALFKIIFKVIKKKNWKFQHFGKRSHPKYWQTHTYFAKRLANVHTFILND